MKTSKFLAKCPTFPRTFARYLKARLSENPADFEHRLWWAANGYTMTHLHTVERDQQGAITAETDGFGIHQLQEAQ